LKWFDLVPVLSWIFYGGKSRCCKRKLSMQYPIVEFVTGAGFLLITNYELRITNNFFLNNLTIEQFSHLFFYFFIFVLFFTIFLQDLKYQAIHTRLLQFLIAITLIFNFQFSIFNENIKYQILNFNLSDQSSILYSRFVINFFVAFLAALPFFLIYKLSQERWLGEGDVWIVFAMGLLLGFPGIFWALYFGIILGGIVSIFVLLLHLKKMRDTISLGPFLILGLVISFLWRF
jgi:leader peptidase (prepilin peptidase) / N-methyltransferase